MKLNRFPMKILLHFIKFKVKSDVSQRCSLYDPKRVLRFNTDKFI